MISSSILKSDYLEYDKSAYTVSLKEHESGLPFVEIKQNIKSEDFVKRSILINPNVLADLARVLTDYTNEVEKRQPFKTKKGYINESTKSAILARYFKGVPINELALHFRLKEDQIQDILENQGAYIVSQKEAKPPQYRRKRKSKRKPKTRK